jgi:hypothetical protein
MAADSRQGSSSDHGDRGPARKVDFIDGDVFEQRRLRHITSILLRNVQVPSTSTTGTSAASSLPRPRPRRSVSTASNSSASTIRRASSTRSVQGKTRGRASSIASSYQENGGIDDEIYLQPDLTALRKDIESRLCMTFVTLSALDGDQELYRSRASALEGVNFEWGRAAGSISDLDGLPFDRLGDVGAYESVRIKVWYKRKEGNEKGEAREENDSFYVYPGSDAKMGWSILWQQDVNLHCMSKLAEDPSMSMLPHNSNTILLGLTYPLGQIQPVEREEVVGLDRLKVDGSQERSKLAADHNKGEQVHYYIVTDLDASRPEPPAESIAEITPEHKAAIQAKLKSGKLVRGYQIEDILR